MAEPELEPVTVTVTVLLVTVSPASVGVQLIVALTVNPLTEVQTPGKGGELEQFKFELVYPNNRRSPIKPSIHWSANCRAIKLL